jgi:hypothetical protein
MTKQFLIDAMSSTLLERLEFFVDQNDYATSDAIYSEFIVNGKNPEDGSYEWCFILNLAAS